MKPMGIVFAKMHGLGNDFVVINGLQQAIDPTKLPISDLAHRHRGIGFDQLLIIEPSNNADFFCRIFNSDGSEAEQCGNGLRCVARFVHENKLTDSNEFVIETKAGTFPIEINDYDHVRVAMGKPDIQEKSLPIELTDEFKQATISVLSMGNPHAVLRVDELQQIHADKLAPVISAHHYFPHGVNIGFMQVLQQNHIRLRTFERGAGETLACGSNACAAAIAGMINGWLAAKVKVEFSQGSLWVEWQGDDKMVYQTGPAEMIYTGKF